jgi:hypothetical protein
MGVGRVEVQYEQVSTMQSYHMNHNARRALHRERERDQ